jgi:hypothetical protein
MIFRARPQPPLLKCSGIDGGEAPLRRRNSRRPGLTFMNFGSVIGFARGFLQYKYLFDLAPLKG